MYLSKSSVSQFLFPIMYIPYHGTSKIATYVHVHIYSTCICIAIYDQQTCTTATGSHVLHV